MGSHHRYCAPAISRTLAVLMAVGAVALDQLSHALIAATRDDGTFPMSPTHWLTLTPQTSSAGDTSIVTIALAAASIALTYWLFKARNRMRIGPIGLLLGGVAANLLCHLQKGVNAGFVDIHLGSSHMPLLGIGDLFSLLGITILLLTNFAPRKYAYCDQAN